MRYISLSFLIFCLNLFVPFQVYPQQNITITYLQNDGVLISDGNRKVLIDAVFSSASGWINLNATEANKLINAQAPYNDVDLILITHNHGDHYSPGAVNTHLNNNDNASLIAPPPVAANFSGSQIITVSPARGQSETLTVNGIELEVLHLRHFDAFGNDFSQVQNFGYLVKISGVNILHLGDVHMSAENLQNFNLSEKDIDVVLIPTFVAEAHFMTSHRDALLNEIDPEHIIGLHLLQGNINGILQQVNSLYPGATVFTTPLQSVAFNITSIAENQQLPERFSLAQNYPNPFNPTTVIRFALPQSEEISLGIYNMAGQKIRGLLKKTIKAAGVHSVEWDGKDDKGRNVASGVYLYRVKAGGFSASREMILMR